MDNAVFSLLSVDQMMLCMSHITLVSYKAEFGNGTGAGVSRLPLI